MNWTGTTLARWQWSCNAVQAVGWPEHHCHHSTFWGMWKALGWGDIVSHCSSAVPKLVAQCDTWWHLGLFYMQNQWTKTWAGFFPDLHGPPQLPATSSRSGVFLCMAMFCLAIMASAWHCLATKWFSYKHSTIGGLSWHHPIAFKKHNCSWR